MSLDPSKTYLGWNGTTFPNSTSAAFKAPAGSTIDWGDTTEPETFVTESTSVPFHKYEDGITKHTIVISNLTSIGNYAFSGCSGLTSVTIGNSVTSIGSNAFRSCRSLTSITIPDSVTNISGSAFWNCSSLTSVTIGNSVTSIGYYAFYNCSSLTSVTIPDSVTSIGDHAFSGCSSLMSITIPDSVTSIGEYAFSGTAYYNDENNWGNGVLYIGKHLIKAKTDLSSTYTIKDGTLTIAGSAFRGCSSLTSVMIPASVTSIGSSAFYDCGSLTSATIGNSVTSIGYGAFQKCTSLTSVTIPESVTSIGASAFRGCTDLKTIILFRSAPPTLGSTDAIPSTISSIYVPKASEEAYKTKTNWAAFASKILSDNIYLSFVLFDQKNKEYIDEKINKFKEYLDSKLAN